MGITLHYGYLAVNFLGRATRRLTWTSVPPVSYRRRNVLNGLPGVYAHAIQQPNSIKILILNGYTNDLIETTRRSQVHVKGDGLSGIGKIVMGVASLIGRTRWSGRKLYELGGAVKIGAKLHAIGAPERRIKHQTETAGITHDALQRNRAKPISCRQPNLNAARCVVTGWVTRQRTFGGPAGQCTVDLVGGAMAATTNKSESGTVCTYHAAGVLAF